jgi:membrane protease YdiL (CAAX protease family)
MSDTPDNVYELPPTTEQPEAAPLPRRIPNLGHALLFFLIAALLLTLSALLLSAVGLTPAAKQGGTVTIQHPKLQIAAEAATYVATLLAAWLFYPVLWRRTFLDGIQWHWPAARNQVPKLIVLGLLLATMSSVVDYFFSSSHPPPIDDFFLSQSTAWVVTFFGILIAPVFEEICFRGFLVPAFAIAYDWLSLPRTPQGRNHWLTTTTLTPAAYAFSGILSSTLFALLHAQQIGYAVNALAVLFAVSLVLTFVRVKTQSVAASTLVHAAYNSLIFLMTILGTGGYRHLDRMTK